MESFLDGRLSEEQCDTIATHLEACATCVATITELELRIGSDHSAEIVPESDGSAENRESLKRAVARAIQVASAEPTAESRFQVGMLIGSYRLVQRLGAGGMGVVFLAEHETMRRPVALKVLVDRLQGDPDSTRRFVHEIRTSAKLTHPRFVKSLDAGEFSGSPYLVMDYLEGVSLSSLVRSWGRLPVADVCEIGRQIAEGLQVLAEQKLVHRDMKPSNVMLVTEHSTTNENASAPSPTIKILDFGVARWHESAGITQAVTLPSLVLGTLEYMAPEQVEASSQVDERADWYSLGATLFKLLVGAAPLELSVPADASPLAKAAHLKTESAPPIRSLRRDVPRAVARIVGRLLSHDPTQRPSPKEVQRALAPFAADADLPRLLRERPETPCSQPTTFRRTSRLRYWKRTIQSNLHWLLGAAVLLLGVIVYATNYGNLEIEVLDEDTKVVISRGGKVIEVIDTREKRRVRLHPDKYELTLENSDKHDLVLSTDQVTIRRGTTEIARVKLHQVPAPGKGQPAPPEKTRIVADWRFAQDANQKPVRDAQMLLSFEGDARLWDDSGLKHSANTFEHPRYKKYDAAADATRAGLDGWALQTGRTIGSLWCPTGVRVLARSDYFSVWCRVRLDRNQLDGDQTLLARPGDWELSIRKDGHLIVKCGSSILEIEKREWGDHEPVPLTKWVGQWIDIGLTFDRDLDDNGANVVTVYLDGLRWFTRRGVHRNRNASDLHVGCLGANKQVFDGLFDRILIYDGVLDAEGFRDLSKPRFTERISSAPVFTTAISPDENLLATGGGQDDIELRSFPALELKQTLRGHGNFVHSLAFSHDGKWLASGGEDYFARIWNVASGQVRHILEGENKVFCVAFSPDDKYLASTEAYGVVRIWDVATGEATHVLRRHRGWVWTAAFSPNGKWLATGEGNAIIKLWELPTFREVTTLPGHTAWVRTLVFSPDSKWLYSGSGDHTIKVWNVEQQELKASLPEQAHVVQSLDVSPDGRVLVSGGFDHAVKFWDTETLKELPIGGRHARRLQSVRFVPRSMLVVSGSEDGAIRAWPVNLNNR